MTREEALEWFKDRKKMNLDDKCQQAEDMAIKALEQEPCEDSISREAILLEIDKIKDNYGGLLDVAMFIRGLPSVNPQPKTGHWIEHKHNGIAHIECSECLSWFLRSHLLRNSYCPNCGSKMED